MDKAYNQHSPQVRRKNRSTTNLNHLSLAPLTPKMPLHDADSYFIDWEDSALRPTVSTSYLHGKSAPTTPSVLARTPTRRRTRSRTRPFELGITTGTVATDGLEPMLGKSKSAVHLGGGKRIKASSTQASGATSPACLKQYRPDAQTTRLSARNRNNSEWLLRTGALISDGARESKGQAWLVSRQSSTNLSGIDCNAEEDDAVCTPRAEARPSSSHRSSRRGSDAFSRGRDVISVPLSPVPNRSRRSSRRSSHANLAISHDQEYFDAAVKDDDLGPGPDFVNLDERLEANGTAATASTYSDEEADVRRLMRNSSKPGLGSWLGGMIGLSLFTVPESSDASDTDRPAGRHSLYDDDDDDEVEGIHHHNSHRLPSSQQLAQSKSSKPDEQLPAPRSDAGVWQDAAWLLSVASKVIL